MTDVDPFFSFLDNDVQVYSIQKMAINHERLISTSIPLAVIDTYVGQVNDSGEIRSNEAEKPICHERFTLFRRRYRSRYVLLRRSAHDTETANCRVLRRADAVEIARFDSVA